MKSINVKRIAAVVAGAALLGAGLAFAGPITFQSIPIINNSGQPQVQVVLGSGAKPSDGIAAANIAAAIANLAYASVPVTASVNMTQAKAVLHPVVTSSNYVLSNQQVFLNESSSAYVSGTYTFQALIGSVINRAIRLGVPQYSKSLQSGASTQYAYPETTSTDTSPAASPYTGVGVPTSVAVTPANNGGGVSFTSFTANSEDNILRVSNSQLPALLSNYGTYGENEYLWLTGFPVFNQESNVSAFQLLDAGGAYQVSFTKPIPIHVSGTTTNTINTAAFQLLGQNWTIINATMPTGTVSSTATLTGGKLEVASSLTNKTTLYVGQNVSSGPFTVRLMDLGQPNGNAVSAAAFNIYYNGALTNVTSIYPNSTPQIFNVSGHKLYVSVSSTFAGLYAYEKYAKVKLYSNVFNFTSGQKFNKTLSPGWTVDLLWTNASSSSGLPNELQGIEIYNTSPVALSQGQSFSFLTNPAVYKITFVGPTLSSGNYDPISVTSSYNTETYQNLGTGGSSAVDGEQIKNLTEPSQVMTVSSSISNAFSYLGNVNNTATYVLTPYELNVQANSPSNTPSEITLSAASGAPGNFNLSKFLTQNPLTVTVKGYTYGTAPSSSQTSTSYTFGSTYTANTTVSLSDAFYNVTSIKLTEAIPFINVQVTGGKNATPIAELESLGPGLLYTRASHTMGLSTALPDVLYNQQNGLPTSDFVFTSNAAPVGTTQFSLGTYSLSEVAVSGTSVNDSLGFAIVNSTSAPNGGSALFDLNYSSSGFSGNNMTYTPTTLNSGNSAIKVGTGFMTERGSKVASIGARSLTVDMAKGYDTLEFAVGPYNVTAVSKHFKTFGPYGIGQATNIPNVSIANVTAKISVSNAAYSISGISNLTAIPSVSTAEQEVSLQNITHPGTSTALVVLDSQANPSSSLILVGSGYVNTLSASLQKSYNISITPQAGPIAQAYGNKILVAGYYANQTTAAANTFIQDLYAKASS